MLVTIVEAEGIINDIFGGEANFHGNHQGGVTTFTHYGRLELNAGHLFKVCKALGVDLDNVYTSMDDGGGCMTCGFCDELVIEVRR